MPVRRGGAKGFLDRHPFHTPKAVLKKLVCLRFDPIGDGALRRPAAWGVVLEATIMGRIVRGRDHDAVGESCLAPAVVGENRMRYDRGWRIFILLRDHDIHPVGRQHLQRAGKSRHRKRVRVHTEKQRAIDLLLPAIQANSLTDGENMPFVESFLESGAPMS